MFDIINEVLVGRYKVKLNDRSYAEGESKVGKTLDENTCDRALRAEYHG